MPKYIARKPLKIGGAYRQPGDLMPEAADWPNLMAYVRNGSIEVVADPPAQARTPAQTPAPVATVSEAPAVETAKPAAATPARPAAAKPKPK